jgi:hypothetical protein
MNLRTGLSLFGILAMAATACGGSSSKTLTTDDFCTMKAAAECQVASICAVSMTACTAVRKADCDAFVTASTVGTRVFTPANVGTCIGKTTSVFKLNLIKPTDMTMVDDACGYVFQGTVADFAACTTKFDCKNKSSICDKGHCAPQSNKAANAQCSDFGAVCPASQYCNMVGAAMMCVDKIAQGKACDAANPCNDTAMLTCTAAVCTKQSDSGGPCTTNADCLATAPYCNPYAGNKCNAGLTFSAGSASCNAFGGTPTTTGAGGMGGTGTDGAAGADATGAGGAAGGGTDAMGAAGADGGGSDGATD